MQFLSSPAIVLRIIEHGDNDKILTFFTLRQGRISLIAKGAQKSLKRFAGVLELFSALNLVWSCGRSRRLPVLQEVSVIHPFDKIRTNINRTTYASCWCELVYRWMEDGQKQVAVYRLLEHLIGQLDSGTLSEELLHITFQLHFMAINGFRPGFECCTKCRMPTDQIKSSLIAFNVRKGGVLCGQCGPCKPGHIFLSKGTVKLLSWALNTPLARLGRIRFSKQAIEESFNMLEAFVPHHLGKETRSSKLLKQLQAR